MKKLLALLLTTVMSITLLASCGDPLYDDFENFLNVEMTEVNANYDKIKAEAATWSELEIEDDSVLTTSVDDVLLPLVNDSLKRLETISPETDEVKALKDKYVKMMQAYKNGFTNISAGLHELDEDKIYAGNDELNNALALLEEYNAALDELATKVGGEIKY